MKILIATTVNPFVEDGSTYIVDWLDHVLKQRGHEVETFRFPFSDRPADVLDQLVGLRLIDLSRSGDRLITVRTPSHLIKHPNKVVWFIHHYRSAYDLWGTKYQELSSTPEGEACRQAIISADNLGLRESSRLFCNSVVVKHRIKRFNSLDAEVLYPPLLSAEQFSSHDYGNYLLYFSRLTRHKRQWLAIESLRYTKTPVALVIAGAPDPNCEPYVSELQNLVRRYRLSGRVTLLPHWVPQRQKIQLFSDCLAALYFPVDEDSYGYPSLEAHASRKAVLTTTDAGGTGELIVDGINGFVRPPDPQLIAEAMDFWYANRSAAKQMGEAGISRMLDLGIDWNHVVQRLLS
jgi:glycosyltransferase involved in cell wall biosynthesis